MFLQMHFGAVCLDRAAAFRFHAQICHEAHRADRLHLARLWVRKSRELRLLRSAA